MKIITKKFLAAVTAAVMTASAFGMPVCAADGTSAKLSGWVSEDGTSRRYNDGVPYTGWLKN